jgi:hypothetical protein
MKTVFLTGAALVALWASGCTHHNLACNDCSSCDGCQSIGRPHMPGQPAYVGHLPHHQSNVGPAGPPSASFAYPYYTTRGPRDFLQANPASIGR